jgi:GNAT superfamily N-acetyltransferase
MLTDIQVITFEEILPLWRQLWEGRESPIEPVSAMVYMGGYDITIMTDYTPTFFGVYDSKDLVAVANGVKTAPDLYRSRGIYVSKSHRQQGLATKLIARTIDQAKEENCSLIWALPKKTSFTCFARLGFVQTSDWFNSFELGPHCYMEKKLNV